MPGEDAKFVRGGRPLREWIADLVSPRRDVRAAAQNAISAMYHGTPTAELHDAVISYDALHVESFNAAVAAAVTDPRFDAAAFVPAAIRRMIADRERAQRLSSAEDAYFFGDEDDADATEPTEWSIERLRQEREEEARGREPRSFGDHTLHLIFEQLGPALLASPKAVHEGLATPALRSTVVTAIERLGSAGVVFADELLGRLRMTSGEQPFCDARALGVISRGSDRIAAALVELVQDDAEWRMLGAAEALAEMGPELGGRRDEAIHVLLERTRPGRREAPTLLRALASVGRDDVRALERVLEYALPRPPRIETQAVLGQTYELDAAMWERGVAIDALGYFAAFSERVTPVLLEAMESFEEYDPDQERLGKHTRVLGAIQRLGPAAASALPTLLDHLHAYRSGTLEDADWPASALQAIAAMGRAAAPARRFLESWRDEMFGESAAGYVPPDLMLALRAVAGRRPSLPGS